jgi:Flp pilus assembly protein TadG
MSRSLITMLRRLGPARQGAAAVEFAFIAPVLSVLAIGVIQYGGAVIANQQLHNGLAAGGVYIMRGGTDAAAAQAVAYGAWPNKPSDAAVTATKACTCAGAGADCNSLCPDQSYPQAYWTFAGTGTYQGPFGNSALSATQVVRTR